MNPLTRATRAIGLAACLSLANSVALASDDVTGPGVSVRQGCIDIVGLDRSGSYNFVKAGLELSARLLAQAEPGCEIVFRWISGASYTNDEFFYRIKIPNTVALNCDANPFDAKCKRKQREIAAQLNQTRRIAVERILAQNPPRSNMTDIMGYVQIGAEILAKYPDGSRKQLYLGTDLEDNVGYKVTPNLAGVDVIVFALQNEPNPTVMQRKRAAWETRFRKWGAKSVSFEALEVVR